MVLYKRLVLLNNKKLKTRFIKFFVIGGLNYPLNIYFVWFGTEIIGFHYLFSVATAYLIITITNFFWHSSYIFKIQRSRVLFVKYISVLVFFYFIHLGFVKILTDWLTVYYLLSVIISISILFLLKFVTFNIYVFNDAREND